MDVTLDVLTEQIISIDVVSEPAVELAVVVGSPGTNGVGVIPGGTTGQVLAKSSDADFDTAWEDPGAGTVASVNGESGIVSLTQDDIPDGTTTKQYTATEKTKLAGVATGATANDTDANLKARANHTGTQAISTIVNLQTSLDGKAASSHTHIASQVTDFATAVDARIQNIIAAAPAALDTLDEIAAALNDDPNFAATMTTALAGKQALNAALTAISGLSPTANDVMQYKSGAWTNRTIAQLKTDLALTKSDVGLGSVDNTADTAKPVSTAQQTALDARMVWADGTQNTRPTTSSKVIWVGGTTQPTGMLTGDIWIKA